MTARADVFQLKCPSCGVGLEVPRDLESLVCAYCGAQALVEVHGGTVSLRKVMDAVERVQAAADRTTAELTLQRLSAELAVLQGRYATYGSEMGHELAEAKGGLRRIVYPPIAAVLSAGLMGWVGAGLVTENAIAGGVCLLRWRSPALPRRGSGSATTW